MTEEWRDVEGYNGLYQVSSLGRVKSLNYNKTSKEKNLKPVKLNTGYLRVNLHKNNKIKIFLVHRLVAAAFIPNPENKPYIDHINTIKDYNRVENLHWVTQKENVNNPISRKNFFDNAVKFGKDNYHSKAVYQYSLDNKFIRKWGCMHDVQRELGFDPSSISKCCLGRLKTAYRFIWQYA